jgi:putative DNA primase/helicase
MRTDIKTELKGRWSSVLQSIGFPVESLTGKHGPCVFCGGTNRSRYDKNKETLFCSGCGHRSGIEVAMAYLNLSYKETAQYLRPNLRNYKVETIKAPNTEANKARIKELHAGLKRLTGSCIASKYLAGRGIAAMPEADCYFHPGLDYVMDDGTRLPSMPAMVSVIRTAEGELSTYHLTYLSQDGKKADVPVQRKICPVILPMSGGAVRLFSATNTLCIAEGIETALSAYMDHGIPTWAAVNAGNMAALVIPESIKNVYIVADADDNFTGQQAAYTLARRLKIAGGRETVKVILLIDQEQVVDSGFKMDMNDYVILHAAA